MKSIDEQIKKFEDEKATATDPERIADLRYILRDLYNQKSAPALKAAGFTRESYAR